MARRRTVGSRPSAVRADSAPAKIPAQNLDSLRNVLTGLGVTGRDWRQHTELVAAPLLTQDQIDALYQDDFLAARIVDAVAEHATRRWVRITVEGDGTKEDTGRQILDALEDLDAPAKFTRLMQLDRKDGGAVMLLGANDGLALDNPLDLTRVSALKALHVTERAPWTPGPIETDPTKEWFGEPTYFDLAPVSGTSSESAALSAGKPTTAGRHRVHRTRMIILRGVRVSERALVANKGWGQSSMQRARGSIVRYGETWGHVGGAMKHLSQTVLGIKGFNKVIAADVDATLQNRLAVLNIFRSLFNMIALDADNETLTEVEAKLAGVDPIMLRVMDDVAAAAEMPLSLLFGHSPAGFSQDDKPGMRNFYDSVHLKQRRILGGPINRVIEVLLGSKDGPTKGAKPDRWQVEWLPLVEETAEEISVRRKRDAETDAALVGVGAIDPEESRARLKNDPSSLYVLDDNAPTGPEAEPVLGPDGKPIEVAPNASPARTPQTGAPVMGSTPGAKLKPGATSEPLANTALNGAQVSSALEIVKAVAAEELPRESGVAMIEAFFNMSPEAAEKIMGTVGNGFVAKKPDPPPMPFGGGRPGAPPPGGAKPKPPEAP